MKTHTLEQLRIGIRNVVNAELGASVANTVNLRYLADEMTYELTAFLLAERLPPEQETATETVQVSYPDGWWPTLRHQYRDRWWMRRWVKRRPVRMHTETRTMTLRVSLERYRTYPRSSLAVPALGAPVCFVETEKVVFLE